VQGQGREEEEAAEGGQDTGGEGEETVLRGENSEVSSYLSFFLFIDSRSIKNKVFTAYFYTPTLIKKWSI
jgi:hypothetical protein